MSNELRKGDVITNKGNKNYTYRNKEVKSIDKEYNNDENKVIDNPNTDKYIKSNKNINDDAYSNFVKKKNDFSFSKSTVDLNDAKKLSSKSKYHKEKEKTRTENGYKPHNSNMKYSKQKERDLYFKKNKTIFKKSYSKENSFLNKSYENFRDEISIKPLNKKYINSPDKKNKRSYKELDYKIHKKYSHSSSINISEKRHISKKHHHRKRYKYSPENCNKRKDIKKREKQNKTSIERSLYRHKSKQEGINYPKDSECFSKDAKKTNILHNKEQKFFDDKYGVNKEKFSNKPSEQCYYNHMDHDKTNNYKTCNTDKEIISKRNIQESSVSKYANEDENHKKEKRKDMKYMVPDPEKMDNHNETYQIREKTKAKEKTKTKKKNMQNMTLLEDNNVSKRNVEKGSKSRSKSKSKSKSGDEENDVVHADERSNEQMYSTRSDNCTEKNTSESSNIEEDSAEGCETPNEHSSDSEQNKTDCILNGCRNVKIYKKLNKISEGTYGTVYRAKNKKTKKIVALKQLKHFSSIHNEGFAITSLREINILLQLKHENVLSIKEVIIGKNLNDIYLVMEYIEHELKILLDNKSPSFTISELKCLLKQLLSGINYLHMNWVMHRDLKPTNLLYDNKGYLKICDFGMSRKYGHITSHNFTKNVVTLWYRAPELLLGETCYTNKIDIWSIGCIFAEMILKKPLFVADNEYEELMKILSLLGLPDKEYYPEFYEYSFISKNKDLFKKKKIKMNVSNIRSCFPTVANQFSGLYLSNTGLDLLQKLLDLNPKNRISANEALNHSYFKEFPKPTEMSDMPIIPDTNKLYRSKNMTRHFNLLDKKNIQFHS